MPSFLLYTEDMKTQDGKVYDLSNKVPTLEMTEPQNNKKWKPSLTDKTTTFTHKYGHGLPNPSLPVNELAEQYVIENYVHISKGSPEFKRLTQSVTDQYMKSITETEGM